MITWGIQKTSETIMEKHNLSKEEALCALYYSARIQGMGALAFRPGGLSLEEATAILAKSSYVDYLKGRVIKVDFSCPSEIDPRLYDRDNGDGAAEFALLNYATSSPQQREKFHATS
jgi:hypothetical protein